MSELLVPFVLDGSIGNWLAENTSTERLVLSRLRDLEARWSHNGLHIGTLESMRNALANNAIRSPGVRAKLAAIVERFSARCVSTGFSSPLRIGAPSKTDDAIIPLDQLASSAWQTSGECTLLKQTNDPAEALHIVRRLAGLWAGSTTLTVIDQFCAVSPLQAAKHDQQPKQKPSHSASRATLFLDRLVRQRLAISQCNSLQVQVLSSFGEYDDRTYTESDVVNRWKLESARHHDLSRCGRLSLHLLDRDLFKKITHARYIMFHDNRGPSRSFCYFIDPGLDFLEVRKGNIAGTRLDVIWGAIAPSDGWYVFERVYRQSSAHIILDRIVPRE